MRALLCLVLALGCGSEASLAGPDASSADATGPDASACAQAMSTGGTAATLPGARAWTNPSAAAADDGNSATVSALDSSEITDRLVASGFALPIPPFASVTGVAVEVKRSSTQGTATDYSVALRLPVFQGRNTLYVASRDRSRGAWPAGTSVVTYGGATDDWGGSYAFGGPLRVSELTDPGFGVMLIVGNGGTVPETIGIDSIKITVYYTSAASIGPNSPTVGPSQLFASDGVSIDFELSEGQTSGSTVVSGFGFNTSTVPSGVFVEIEGWGGYSNQDFTNIADSSVELVVGGAAAGGPQNYGTWSPNLAYMPHGGVNNLWGIPTLSASEVSSPSFGVSFSETNAATAGAPQTVSIDHVRVTLLHDAFDTHSDGNTPTGTDEAFATPWSNPTHALGLDGNTASMGLSYLQVSDLLVTSHHGFAIPSGATIEGIELAITRSSSSGNIADRQVRIVRGTAHSEDRSGGAWPNTLTRTIYGGPHDLWGLALTPDDINDPSFGALIQGKYLGIAGTDVGEIDDITITVHYCP